MTTTRKAQGKVARFGRVLGKAKTEGEGEHLSGSFRKETSLRGAPPADEVEAGMWVRRGEVRSAKMTVRLRPDVLQRLHNAVFWTPGETVTGFVEREVEAALERLERERGGPFPDAHTPLPTGGPRRGR